MCIYILMQLIYNYKLDIVFIILVVKKDINFFRGNIYGRHYK